MTNREHDRQHLFLKTLYSQKLNRAWEVNVLYGHQRAQPTTFTSALYGH